MAESAPGHTVGRYVLYDEIASGGMATVHMGRLIGPVGFSRVVAVKRSHTAYAKDPGFVAMMLDEARLASRVRHPNVVSILDVVATDEELLLVMEYVQGETLARLMRAAKRAGERMAPDIGAAIVIDTLRGLHAAHEARGPGGEPLGIVHRDVSPQNILVGTDGSAHLLDFGVAKAASRTQNTDDGQLKGKLGYISPEQISGREVDRRVDVFAASIVAWECIAGRRLFVADDMVATLARVMDAEVPSLQKEGFDIPEALEKAITRGLALDPSQRFQTAEEMAREIEASLRPASRERVAAWVEHLAGEALSRRLETMRRIETGEADSGIVQVPVGISPDQSGKVPTLRASVGGADAKASDDPGTFPSTLATQSIVPPAAPAKGWRRAALVLLALLALGALGVAALWSRRAPVETARVATPPSEPASTSSALVPAQTAPAPSASVAPPAASATADPAPSAVEPAARPTARPTQRPSAKPRASTKPTEPAPPPPPVDPLVDQR